VVSQRALNAFLSRPFDKDAGGLTGHPNSIDQNGLSSDSQAGLNGLETNGGEKPTRRSASLLAGEILVDEILCPHGKLDPGKTADMKRIDRVCPVPSTVPLFCAQKSSRRLRTNRT
jgi:hypothetical protein